MAGIEPLTLIPHTPTSSPSRWEGAPPAAGPGSASKRARRAGAFAAMGSIGESLEDALCLAWLPGQAVAGPDDGGGSSV